MIALALHNKSLVLTLLKQKVKTLVIKSQHYNGDDSYLFVNGKEICKFETHNIRLKLN